MDSFETLLGRSRIVHGAGSLDRLGQRARELGMTRVLLVTDRGLREAGHADRACAALRDASVETTIYDGVEPDPTTRHVAAGLAAARESRIDGIIGLGGGSAMDCAKGVNFLLTNGGRMEDYQGTNRAGKPMLPSVGIPTTAGTGSEAQSYALIRREEDGAKMACGDRKALFRTVILDPTLCASAPVAAVAASAVDAIAHAVESHVSKRANPVSRLFSREAWRLLEAGFPAVATTGPGGADLDTWSKMQLGAFFSGAAIEHSMLGAAHACANPLTARFPIPHGNAVGIFLPHVVRFNTPVVGSSYDELCGTAESAKATTAPERRVRELIAIAGIPTSLREYEVPRERLAEMAAEAERQWTAGFNPRAVTRKELREIYEAAW